MKPHRALFPLFGEIKLRGTSHGTYVESSPSERSFRPRQWIYGRRRQWTSAAIALSIPLFLAGCGGTGALHSQGASSPSIAGTSAPGTSPGSGGGASSGNSGSGSSSGSSDSGNTNGGSSGSDPGSSGNVGGSPGGGGTQSAGGGSTGGGAGDSIGGAGDAGNGNNDPGTTIANIQTAPNWRSFGQVGPSYVDCSPSPCQGIQWSMKQGVTLPSLSNNATQFTLGGAQGTAPYGDVLFTVGLLGQNSKTVKDSDHTLLPTLHHFIYDADFYVTNVSITQSLEFDLSLWMSGIAGMTFGTQCNNLGDHDWDIWDNQIHHWVSTGAPCAFVKGWNHVTIRVQRQSDNSTLYQSITLNGKTYSLNKTYPGMVSPAGWWGLDANYQMDGNSHQAANTTYVDNLSVTYW